MSAPAYMTECIPVALYECSGSVCGSHPAEKLGFFEGDQSTAYPTEDIQAGWYCLKHRNDIREQIALYRETPFFPTLAEELQRRHAQTLEDIVIGGYGG